MTIYQLIVEKKKTFAFLVGVSLLMVLVYGGYWKARSFGHAGKRSSGGRRSKSGLPVVVAMKSATPNATSVGRGRVDVHKEDPIFGHAGDVDAGGSTAAFSTVGQRRQSRAIIAVGGGITSGNMSDVGESNFASKLPFFTTFLPTFCQTASRDFEYRVYLAYDHTDRVFGNGRLQTAFRRAFDDATRRLCVLNGSAVDVSLHLVECSHAGKPAWAQNDAMLEAYLDHVDYLYRVNDDTRMLTGGWTEKFISTLEAYDPPRVGVVGPNNSGGNVGILTYDFVHRTHVDVFGFYYPRLFTDWYADDWITMVYKPSRSTKLSSVQLQHMTAFGRRYKEHMNLYKWRDVQIDDDKPTVTRYVRYR